MVKSWRKVYVFVSSTFNDMHAERDYLVKQVFPELREWCEQRCLRLIDIDLRWGVTEQEAERNKNVVKVCLDRINDCRPFFLCFLGQRRGWVPSTSDVSQATLDLFPGLADHLGNASVTELEILHAVSKPFDGWNGRPQPGSWLCERAFFYLREPGYLQQLPGDAIQHHVYSHEGIDDEAERQRHDQALSRWREDQIPQTGRPVRRYQARFDARALSPELALPTACVSRSKAVQRRWRESWRKVGLVLDDDITEILPESDTEQQANEINRRLVSGRLTDFTCCASTDGNSATERARLGTVVLRDLQQAIQAEFPDHEPSETSSGLQRELQQQDYFVLAMTEGFIERPGDFEALDDYVEGDSRRVLRLVGPAGIGKSALLARWIEHYRRRCLENNGATVHFRFIGASDRSTDAEDVLRSLLEEWKLIHKLDEVPADRTRIYLALHDYLREVSCVQKTVIVLDGLNQLETGLTDLTWLPDELPHNAKLIVSIKQEADDKRESSSSRQSLLDRPMLNTKIAPFQEQDQKRIIVSFTSQFLKELDDEYVQRLIASPGATNPLFLKAVLSELRVYGSYAGLANKIEADFGATPRSAFDAILRRLESDTGYVTLEPRHAVPLVFGFLSHARQGLSMAELIELVDANYPWPPAPNSDEAQLPPRRQRIRETIYTYLRQLRSFLELRADRLDFFYEAFRLASADRYTRADFVPGARPAEAWHTALASFFRAVDLGERWDENDPLCDLTFVSNIKERVEGIVMKVMFENMTAMFENPPRFSSRDLSQAELVEQALIQIRSEFAEACMSVLGVDEDEAQRMFHAVFTQGEYGWERIPQSQAQPIVDALKQRNVVVEARSLRGGRNLAWRGSEPRAYNEFLYHAAHGRAWEDAVDALVDPHFIQRFSELNGFFLFVLRFKELTGRMSADAAGLAPMQRLCDSIPITPATRPLLDDLVLNIGNDVEQVCNLLTESLREEKDRERALVPFQAFLKRVEYPESPWPAAIRARLEQMLAMLVKCRNVKVAWRSCQSYWEILPGGDPRPLLEVARSEDHHPILRSEAARQLGECDRLELVPELQALATCPVGMVGEMAGRSARRILASHRRITADTIDDWSQPEQLPQDFEPLWQQVEALGVNVDRRRMVAGKPLVVAVNETSSDSFDLRLITAQLLLLLLRNLPCTIICVEGSDRKATLTPLKHLASAENWRTIAMRFMWDGVISPEEYINLACEYRLQLLGIEYSNLYERAAAEKYRGNAGTEIVASIERATGMLDNCFRWMRRYPCDVVILLTKVLPGFMISRLMDLEVAELDHFIENLLPERVTEPHPQAHQYSYVRINMMQLDDKRDDEFNYDPILHHLLVNHLAMRDYAELGSKAAPDKVAAEEQGLRRFADGETAPDSLRGAHLERTDLRGIDLSGRDGWQIKLKNSDLREANLRGGHFHGGDLNGALLSGADLRGANLFEARLGDADLTGADLSQANLVQASLGNSNLKGARLEGALLFGANFNDADLTECDLRGADLRQACLAGTNLAGADLTGANLRGARFNPKTTWPGPVPTDQGLELVDPPIHEDWTWDLPTSKGMNFANLGAINLKLGERTAGLAQIDLAVGLWVGEFGNDSPDTAACINLLVRALQELDRHEDALPLARHAVEIWKYGQTKNHPSTSTGLNNLGLSLFRVGKIEEAKQTLLEAIEMNEGNFYPYYWLAQVHRQLGEAKSELASWERYLELGATDAARRQEAVERISALGTESK